MKRSAFLISGSLVFGNVDESLEGAVAKGNALTASKNGPFNLLLLLASPNVFKDKETLQKIQTGEIQANLHIYIVVTGSSSKANAHEDDVDELPYGLEESGSFTLANNVTIYADTGRPGFLKNLDGLEMAWASDKTAQEKEINVCDILVTDVWPQNILTGVPSSKQPKDEDPRKSTSSAQGSGLAKLLSTCSPRYHFVSSPATTTFYERPPYKTSTATAGDESQGSADRITRFISLGSFGGSARWFYAFNIDVPFSPDSAAVPADATPNPFTAVVNAPEKTSTSPDGIIFATSAATPSAKRAASSHTAPRDRPSKRRGPLPAPVRPDTCFLCLSNPSLATHLIASVASKSYLALAKGPLSLPNPIPSHAMIVPIAHTPVLLPTDNDRAEVELERWKYVFALSQMYQAHGYDSVVAFDISRSRGIHIHTQVVAVRETQAANGLVPAFLNAAERAGLSMIERPLDEDETEYFRVQVVRPSGTTSLVVELPEGAYFDLQFGRKVLASTMGLEDRLDWRACAQTVEEEKADCTTFKSEFKQYDFTL